MKLFATPIAALVVLGVTSSVLAGDPTVHNSLPACYASINHQCYGNGQNNCSEDDYNWGLDQCDEI